MKKTTIAAVLSLGIGLGLMMTGSFLADSPSEIAKWPEITIGDQIWLVKINIPDTVPEPDSIPEPDSVPEAGR